MENRNLTPTLFIGDGDPTALKAPKAFPFLFNRNATGLQFAQAEGTLITLSPERPELELELELELGTTYRTIRACSKTIESLSHRTLPQGRLQR